MNTPTVVAFIGKRGSGKSTAAGVLIENGYKDVKFADPLKNMLRALYYTVGLDDEQVERRIEGDLKESEDSILQGWTPRHAMQTLGTEWRDMLGTNMWSDILMRRVSGGSCGRKVVISDYRFPHETLAVRALGGTVIRISSRGITDDIAAQHISETAMDGLDHDFLIENDGTIGDLRMKVWDLAKSKGWVR